MTRCQYTVTVGDSKSDLHFCLSKADGGTVRVGRSLRYTVPVAGTLRNQETTATNTAGGGAAADGGPAGLLTVSKHGTTHVQPAVCSLVVLMSHIHMSSLLCVA